MTDTPVVLARRMRDELDRTLGGLLGAGETCALVDFPNHGNVGDNAIWLGQAASLARLGVKIGYCCDWLSYHPRALAAAVPEGPVLLQGGGNLGDLWPVSQALRERVLADFPDRLVIQLPQSVWYTSPDWPSVFGERVARHGRLVILVRDRASLERARRLPAASVMLCPDAAFGATGTLTGVAPDEPDVTWLLRTDCEARDHGSRTTSKAPAARDWVPVAEPLNRAARMGSRAIGALPVARFRLPFPFTLALARRRVLLGLRLFRGAVVVSDRLHGHVLATMTGRPSVVLDNSYGKNFAFVRTWATDNPWVVTVEGWASAEREAGRLAALWRRRNAPATCGDEATRRRDSTPRTTPNVDDRAGA